MHCIARVSICHTGEHQMELLDCVAAKFYEEPGVFKLLVSDMWCMCLLFLERTWSLSCV